MNDSKIQKSIPSFCRSNFYGKQDHQNHTALLLYRQSITKLLFFTKKMKLGLRKQHQLM